MKISELAHLVQLPVKTIRYYESAGLIPAPARTDNRYRDYSKSDIDRLVFIRRCRNLQIPLEQIKQLVAVQTDKQAPCNQVNQIIANQLTKVRNTLAELTSLEATLTTLAESCDRHTVQECKILDRLTAKSD